MSNKRARSRSQERLSKRNHDHFDDELDSLRAEFAQATLRCERADERIDAAFRTLTDAGFTREFIESLLTSSSAPAPKKGSARSNGRKENGKDVASSKQTEGSNGLEESGEGAAQPPQPQGANASKANGGAASTEQGSSKASGPHGETGSVEEGVEEIGEALQSQNLGEKRSEQPTVSSQQPAVRPAPTTQESAATPKDVSRPVAQQKERRPLRPEDKSCIDLFADGACLRKPGECIFSHDFKEGILYNYRFQVKRNAGTLPALSKMALNLLEQKKKNERDLLNAPLDNLILRKSSAANGEQSSKNDADEMDIVES